MADYAILLVLKIADERDQVITARDLAEKTRLPIPTVSKLLKTLAHAQIVQAQRGSRGGYALARNLGAVSALEIIEAMDGPIALTQCVHDSPEDRCELQDDCLLTPHWKRVTDVIRNALSSLNLKDLTASNGFHPELAGECSTDNCKSQRTEPCSCHADRTRELL